MAPSFLAQLWRSRLTRSRRDRKPLLLKSLYKLGGGTCERLRMGACWAREAGSPRADSSPLRSSQPSAPLRVSRDPRAHRGIGRNEVCGVPRWAPCPWEPSVYVAPSPSSLGLSFPICEVVRAILAVLRVALKMNPSQGWGDTAQLGRSSGGLQAIEDRVLGTGWALRPWAPLKGSTWPLDQTHLASRLLCR